VDKNVGKTSADSVSTLFRKAQRTRRGSGRSSKQL